MTEITGSISSGTMRPQDLVPIFLSVLSVTNPTGYAQLTISPFPLPPAYAEENDESGWWDSEDCNQFLESLFDSLDESAPEGCYFGANEGDGSDYGFWPIEIDE